MSLFRVEETITSRKDLRYSIRIKIYTKSRENVREWGLLKFVLAGQLGPGGYTRRTDVREIWEAIRTPTFAV